VIVATVHSGIRRTAHFAKHMWATLAQKAVIMTSI